MLDESPIVDLHLDRAVWVRLVCASGGDDSVKFADVDCEAHILQESGRILRPGEL